MNETRRAVLDALDDGPVTGPELADHLGVSRTAVWKHVEALRDAGFTVKSVADGYTLAGVPEYGAEAVEFGLDAAFEVEYHDSLPSTNDRARELAADGASDVVVLADRQTGGRGRRGRQWSSPAGGVWMSVVLRPDLPPARAPLLTLAAAVAVTDAARELGVDAAIKWPNDVVVPARTTAPAAAARNSRAPSPRWRVRPVGCPGWSSASASTPTSTPPTSTATRRASGRRPATSPAAVRPARARAVRRAQERPGRDSGRVARADGDARSACPRRNTERRRRRRRRGRDRTRRARRRDGGRRAGDSLRGLPAPPVGVAYSSPTRTVNTGTDEDRTTFSATLPSNRRSMPPRPWVPITTRSQPSSSA